MSLNFLEHHPKKYGKNTEYLRIATQPSEHHFKTITRMGKYKTCHSIFWNTILKNMGKILNI